jgi:hypothetical protein
MNQDRCCPKCKVSWVGESILEEGHEFYSGSIHLGREILYEAPLVYDGVIAVKCPDCDYLGAHGAGTLKVSDEDSRTVFEAWQAGDL